MISVKRPTRNQAWFGPDFIWLEEDENYFYFIDFYFSYRLEVANQDCLVRVNDFYACVG
jgi:hypothetical protein